ncbi:hypothetical protein GCM10009828_039600 [Actinoplanes couchii]
MRVASSLRVAVRAARASARWQDVRVAVRAAADVRMAADVGWRWP